LKEGELEIGQVSAMLKDIKPAGEIINEIWLQFNEALSKPLK
jgi:enoyl-[acyl-carrier protein] reductase II